MSVAESKTYEFPEGEFTVDLHDLAAILLREFLFSEPRFKFSRLLEISTGSVPVSCLPVGGQSWTYMAPPKIGYFLKTPEGFENFNAPPDSDSESEDESDTYSEDEDGNEGENKGKGKDKSKSEDENGNKDSRKDNDKDVKSVPVHDEEKEKRRQHYNSLPPIEPSDFLDEDFRCSRELDSEVVETIFWRVHTHNRNFLLHHALQIVLDTLPPKQTTLRIRTSSGDVLSTSPRSFIITEMDVTPLSLLYIANFERRPDSKVFKNVAVTINQYTHGEQGIGLSYPWISLTFVPSSKRPSPDEPPDADEIASENSPDNISLDLCLPGLNNVRGLGHEIFALEKSSIYHNKLLPKGCDADILPIHSSRIDALSPERAQPAHELAGRVLTRLEKILTTGQRYCAYCGKEDPKTQCSRCKGKNIYCGQTCQKKAWPYHKVWCKVDAESLADDQAIDGKKKE